MVMIYLNNQQTKVPISPDLEEMLPKVTRRLLAQENQDGPGELSITLVSDGDIQELNRLYRQQDRPTDVLSFPGDPGLTKLDPEEPRIWGDVVISVDRALEQASTYGHSFMREMAFLVAHGVLHLLGCDHTEAEAAEIMEARVEQVLASFGIGRETSC